MSKTNEVEETIRIPISLKLNLETGEKTLDYRDIPIEIFMNWIESTYRLSRGKA